MRTVRCDGCFVILSSPFVVVSRIPTVARPFIT